MTTTLSDIRFIVERDIEATLQNESIINWANMAQNDFTLRLYVPDSLELVINTTDLSYDISSEVRKIRTIKRQSDIDLGINRAIYPVYTLYNGKFEVPVAFDTADTLLIDYYRRLAVFEDITDEILLEDRHYPLYSSYMEMRYYRLPSTIKQVGPDFANQRYQDSLGIYESTKKQVADSYIIDIGIQHPAESGW